MATSLRKTIFSFGSFWIWNFIFVVLLIYAETEAGVLFPIIHHAMVGSVPLDFSIYSLIIFIIPILSFVIGLTILKGKPQRLLQYFFGFEMPILLLFILRLWVFKELNGPTWHLFLILFLGTISYLSDLLIPIEKRPNWLLFAQKIGHTLLLIIGIYIAIIIAFYSIPALWTFIKGFFNFHWLDFYSFFEFLLTIFGILTVSIFIILPFAMVNYYLRAFQQIRRISLPFGKIAIGATLGINILLFITLNYSQPQTYAFDKLDRDFSKTENKIWFHKHSKQIKKGLLNAYLLQYRYLSSTESSNQIQDMYQRTFNLKKETAKPIQTAFNYVISPFLYQGDFYEDSRKAAQLYEKYFDASLQEAESKAIKHAIKATWDQDGIEAGLLNIDEKKVLLLKQEITSTESDQLAEIEIHETYQNQTFNQQEIFYYFELPPNSVMTGLWLSDDKGIPKKYSFNVSPRGAAQKIYKQEVRRRIDPSLLEQVGPNQYRLRAFPILPKRNEYRENYRDFEVIEGDEFDLWLAYKTIMSKDKAYRLPKLTEKRNVYWTNQTTMVVNGQESKKNDQWMPSAILANDTQTRLTHIAPVSNRYSIKMEPTQLSNLDISHKKLAIIIDGSLSMHNVKKQLLDALNTFPESKTFVINNSVTEQNLGEIKKAIQSNPSLFFGASNNMDMIQQFSNTTRETFDAIILLTDKGNYHAAKDDAKSIDLNQPLFIWHVGNQRAPIYSDAFLETFKNSHGTIIHSINDLAIQLTQKTKPNILDFQDGILYTLLDTAPTKATTWSTIAAKTYIDNQQISSDIDRVEQLDSIHQIALQQQIVTPYSSMIVLVNDRQKEALKKAEMETDRFDRKVENGVEQLTHPGNILNVGGTPEPEEWILIIIGMAFLFWNYRKTRMV